jgi:hypothetical protein
MLGTLDQRFSNVGSKQIFEQEWAGVLQFEVLLTYKGFSFWWHTAPVRFCKK